MKYGKNQKIAMLLVAAVLGAAASADLSALGEWADLVSRIVAALSGVLTGGAVIKRPGDLG